MKNMYGSNILVYYVIKTRYIIGKDCVYSDWSSCEFDEEDKDKCGLGKSTRTLIELNTTGMYLWIVDNL